ncbi:hypothetical protein B0P06_005270 [Clostridium saccharoperbutylacetonicum]|uniref:Phage protein n=1 Tax=Clostridium saccharoperbutylacetonicum N1-4(HMT) TaxID=931276 RepID=M1MP05_9CLOT|nr:hypothetical protein [Clostridium saccharoperbutylacetonicum]AGF56461.1 hypothetical protein Cspa_c26960 [Clostridium saccharoperbutylacetonicum N1-4(HMT)]NRT62792.1 hypothetical protein [Clostridium saccharoperbutylacetonicum]NSB26146.1 hypothetical protein [Clostridium saccharoperbutylacetonicum]NSB45499.1 hypothetical protein [Clostridium saccharoperbutylacetonicum]
MIKYVDLLYSITKKLRDNYPNASIKIDKKKSEKEIENGLFYVIVSPLKSDTSFNLRKKLLNIYIEYVEEDKTQESSLNKIDELTELFDENISVNNRVLPILNKEPKDTDDNVTLMFTLNYFDSKAEPIPETPDATYDALMGILKLNVIDKD